MTKRKIAVKKVYDSRLEEQYHKTYPHLEFHSFQKFPWVTSHKMKPYVALMNTVTPAQLLLLTQLASLYQPDFYDPRTDQYIETKGILRTQDRMKFQQVVKMYPTVRFKLVAQLTQAQNTQELQALLQSRNQAVLQSNSTAYSVCTSSIQMYCENIKPTSTRATTLSGLTLLRWATSFSDRLLVEGFTP